jgi:DNA-binding transcriptional regulator GbsR (MarR family)
MVDAYAKMKDLMKLVEKYGHLMKEWGYQNAVGYLDSPQRVTAMLEAQQMEAKVEKEIDLLKERIRDAENRRCN